MTITEQLDALVLNNDEIIGWDVHRRSNYYYVTIRTVCGDWHRSADTLPEAAEAATIKAVEAVHELREKPRIAGFGLLSPLAEGTPIAFKEDGDK